MPLAPDQVPEATSLWLWLEAGEDASTAALNDNDPVATWGDLSAAGHDVTQGTAGNRPVLKAGILNGLDIVRFDGSNDHLINTANPNVNDKSCIAVIAIASSPGTGRQTPVGIPGTATFQFLARESDANGNDVGFVDGASEWGSGYVLPADGIFHVVEWTTDPAGTYPTGKYKRIWVDQDEKLDIEQGTATGTHSDLIVGAATTGANFLKGDIAALAFYHNAISESSLHEVAAYFGQKYGMFALPDSRGRIHTWDLEVPGQGPRARIHSWSLATPEPERARIHSWAFEAPLPNRARIHAWDLEAPLPARARLHAWRFETEDPNRRARIYAWSLVTPSASARARIHAWNLVVPVFDRRGRLHAWRLVIPSPAPGTGGPLPDTPETPGGMDPDTGRPVLIQFNRMLPVVFTTAPDSPRGKQSWAHTGGVQARSVASAGLQWVEEYQPRYMTDQGLWAFVAYCRDLAQNERLFMIQPTEPLRSTVFGSISGTPVVSGAGQTGYNLTTSGWTGTLLAGNLVQIDGIHTIFELVTDVTSASPIFQLNPQIRQGGEPQDGAQIFLGPDVRLRAKIDTIEWPDVRAEEIHLIGLRIGFRECP